MKRDSSSREGVNNGIIGNKLLVVEAVKAFHVELVKRHFIVDRDYCLLNNNQELWVLRHRELKSLDLEISTNNTTVTSIRAKGVKSDRNISFQTLLQQIDQFTTTKIFNNGIRI